MTIKPLFDALQFLLAHQVTTAVSPSTQTQAQNHSGALHDLLAFLEPVAHVAEEVLPVVLPASGPIVTLVAPLLNQFEKDHIDNPAPVNTAVVAPTPAPAAPAPNVVAELEKIAKEVAEVEAQIKEG